jgi:hypothetical protein
VHSYKNGNTLAKNMTDEEALKYADDFHIPLPEQQDAAAPAEPQANDQDAIAEQLQQVADASVADAGGDDEDEAPAKTPKKATGGRKRKTATPAAAETPAPASPDKKRRRTSTKATEEKEEPKKSGRKKTKNA